MSLLPAILPDDFEAQLELFDSVYEENISQLKNYKHNYESTAGRIKYYKNLDPFKFDYSEYKDSCSILKNNRRKYRIISDKLNDPSMY